MNEIASRLEKLESIFRKANAPVLQRFNPGLQDSEIASFFSENNIPTHPDLFSLYNWRNGLTSIYGEKVCFTEISPMGSFPNLAEMLALRNDFMGYDYFEVENRHEYVPFLSAGEDDMHLIRVSTGEIYWSSPGIQIYCERRFFSLCSLLDFTLDCFEKKALTMNSIEGLIIDDSYWDFKDDYNN